MTKIYYTFLIATLINVATSSAAVTCTTRILVHSGTTNLFATLRTSDCVDSISNEAKIQKEFGLCYSWEIPGSKGFLGLNSTNGTNCVAVPINSEGEESRARLTLNSFQSPAEYPVIREQINAASGHLYFGRIEKASTILTAIIKQE